MSFEEKRVLSAKWRTYKKRSKQFRSSRGHDRVKNKRTPKPFRIRNLRTKRGGYPYKHNFLRTCNKQRKWKEPKTLIDIFEEKGKIRVVAEFAGFKSENLKIHIKDQRLTLSAETSDRKYYKSLNLPKRVIPDTLCTSYKNGVLEIQLKKALEEKVMDKVAG